MALESVIADFTGNSGLQKMANPQAKVIVIAFDGCADELSKNRSVHASLAVARSWGIPSHLTGCSAYSSFRTGESRSVPINALMKLIREHYHPQMRFAKPTSQYLSPSTLWKEERIVLASSRVSVRRRVLVARFGDVAVLRGEELWHRFGPDEERPVWHDDGHHSLCA
jgi:hypothetical protein